MAILRRKVETVTRTIDIDARRENTMTFGYQDDDTGTARLTVGIEIFTEGGLPLRTSARVADVLTAEQRTTLNQLLRAILDHFTSDFTPV